MEKKSKKKTIIIIVVVVILLLLLLLILGSGGDEEETSSGSDDTSVSESSDDYEDEEDPDTEDHIAAGDGTWTVMVYMCGTDLESEGGFGAINLDEMMSAQLSDKVNVLVETGGTKEWVLNDYADDYEPFTEIDPDVLSYYRIVSGGMELEKTEASANMGDPSTLSNFISWGAKTAPADRYMLIFWDHGGGSAGGVCVDELYDEDTLSLTEIKKAVSSADVPLEAVGFDACLMATLETAEALQGYGHYMIASEETEPGYGWDYTKVLNFLSENPGADGLALGKKIADTYQEKCEENEVDDLITLSVTDLTKIPALSNAFRGLAGEMVVSTQDPTSFRNIYQGAVRAESYGGNTDSEGYTNMVDLGDFIVNTENALSQNSTAVLSALSDAVEYEIHGANRLKSNGLSVFYPLTTDEDMLNMYAQSTDNTAFLEYINIVSGNWDSAEWEESWEDAWKEAYDVSEVSSGKYDDFFNSGAGLASDYDTPEIEEPEEPEEPGEGGQDGDTYNEFSSLAPVQKDDYNIEFSQEINDEGYLELTVNSGLEIVSDVSFELYYEDEETGMYLYMGSDNNIDADYDKGVFIDNFMGEWMTIGDEFVYAELIEANDDYNLYSIPIKLNGEEMYLKAAYDYDKEAFRIIGANDGIDEETGQSGRDIRKLKEGDKIVFLFGYYDPETDEGDVVELGEITWTNDTVMEDSPMDDARFLYMFKITDFFGNEVFGDPVYMEINDGEITEYEP